MAGNSELGNTGITSHFGTLLKKRTDVIERFTRDIEEVGDMLRRIKC